MEEVAIHLYFNTPSRVGSAMPQTWK